jgi:hypothetical protein
MNIVFIEVFQNFFQNFFQKHTYIGIYKAWKGLGKKDHSDNIEQKNSYIHSLRILNLNYLKLSINFFLGGRILTIFK